MESTAERRKDGNEYGIVANIPASFHSADLRNYFSQFIEGNGFISFHFKHRPETKVLENNDEYVDGDTAVAATANESLHDHPHHRHNVVDPTSYASARGHVNKHNRDQKSKEANLTTLCCIVRLHRAKMEKFIRMYHRKPWIDKKGSIISSRCFISRIKVKCENENTTEEGQSQEYRTRGESKLIPSDRETFTKAHLNKLAELNPPDLMPNGNVGTPTAVFLELIRTCRLPPRLIQKLGLTFPKTRTNRRYGSVPFAYGGKVETGRTEERVLTASGQEITDEFDSEGDASPSGHEAGDKRKRKGKQFKTNQSKNCASNNVDSDKQVSESDEDDDDDTCEEWERHEALHEDVTSQGRTKERLFEGEIELKWEKGGSGLVFYTDAAFWDAKDGDFDEKTSDDWDVDMSIYYDEHGGDKDARDYVDMRRMERMKLGVDDTSVFAKPDGIGHFEKHTKGIGRKVLQKQGWQEGRGLGSTVEGMADALDSVGQNTRDKRGFGYHGQKLGTESGMAKRRRTADKDVIISTVYDNPAETDPTEPLLRSRGPHHLKYRHQVEFIKADQTS